MADLKQIKTALISVFHKDGLDRILQLLNQNGVTLISTGGTHKFITDLGLPCVKVEDMTGLPSILGGRVKTLHPKVFGGILARRENESDNQQAKDFGIEMIDLVIVDLYPFAQTVASGASHQDIIEKIDIGGISLIRAAAKNFNDVTIVASKNQYKPLLDILETQGAETTLEQRRMFARDAFGVSSRYDSEIFNYFDTTSGQEPSALRMPIDGTSHLRYAENPHQKGCFYGNLNEVMEQLHGKEISYNNLLDIDAAVALMDDLDSFGMPAFAILKHNNACGAALRDTLSEAWAAALEGDPVSAFGGILIANRTIDAETAAEVNKIFFEAIIAPDFTEEAMEILRQKKNRIILKLKEHDFPKFKVRSALNGALVQEIDTKIETPEELRQVTEKAINADDATDLIFANIIVKHSKSNAIVLAKNKQLLASGIGQTSRVDALRQAIEKAGNFNLSLTDAVMASDAFFPFADCVEIADKAGIRSIIQPGGSIRDNDSIDYCNKNGLAMVFTGFRHFKH
ncbi:MAG: bifunctional phosphoribosylaminoimidazolecarboxamide formyltransferase/IMP cyclohydrolase [Muribaculaceae bacterium]|nr:bifunctional phosphoribosylaminoimidazolecarboxamide formyltransferase/IMP cyclohydrolase [Muribaculaceae bacterium]